MIRTRTLRTIAVGATCAVVGAGAGIAGSSAHEGKGDNGHAKFRGVGHGAPVHAELVLPDRKGGFKEVTLDRGLVESVAGDKLTIKEGTKTATYKTVELTIPADAKIRRGHEAAKLTDLKPGDRVSVLTTGDQTFVKAKPAKTADKQHS
jgi:hypothetical protein